MHRAFRSEYGRTVAVLVRMLGDLSAAEDAVQEAFAAASATWRTQGVPANPQAWLVTTARHRAIDRLRREQTAHRYTPQVAVPVLVPATEPLDDDELQLVFLCCHPALSVESQVVLTLRFAAGLTTAEIARALGAPEGTVAQRLTRAKHKIRTAGIPTGMPAPQRLTERLTAVLAVIYLLYNEGYLTTSGDLLREDLCQEGVRLARELFRLLPQEPEVRGLLALLLLLDARRPARTGPHGELVTLPEQDRSLWRTELVREGHHLVRQCLALGAPGPYQLQAAIQAVHTDGPSTDWAQVLALYDQLAVHLPTTSVATNRVVAVAQVHGPARALSDLDRVCKVDHHVLAVRADLLTQLGRNTEAARLFQEAAARASNRAEREHLLRRASTADTA